MPLNDKEARELSVLDNPDVEFLGPSTVTGLVGGLFQKNARKERVVKLRMKLRMEELGLDPKRDWKRVIDLAKEEEERFDARFGQPSKPRSANH